MLKGLCEMLLSMLFVVKLRLLLLYITLYYTTVQSSPRERHSAGLQSTDGDSVGHQECQSL